MAIVQVQCCVCLKPFEKQRGEFNRSVKLGRRHYCSLRCTGLDNWVNLPPEYSGKIEFLKGHEYKKTNDEFSPFRSVLRGMLYSGRHRNKVSVDCQYLKKAWEEQREICPYTGWKLSLPTNTCRKYANKDDLHASVDRIDSSKGYVPGNIQFTCIMANWAKSAFSEQDLLDFCKAVISVKPTFEPLNETKDSPFRKYIHLASRRCRKSGKPMDLTIESLKALWNKQGGHCPYTGWALDNPHNVQAWDLESYHPARASLDRIDSSNGYTIDNVQFVSGIYNYAKNKGTHADVLAFCEAVVKNKGL